MYIIECIIKPSLNIFFLPKKYPENLATFQNHDNLALFSDVSLEVYIF